MPYQAVLAMPIRGFWMLSANVSRIRAEEALDMIDLYWVANANCGPEEITKIREALLVRMGEPAKGNAMSSREVSADEHKAGIAQLRLL
jgi:hypothetical protein